MPRTLIIGFGNPHRQDDGAGPYIALAIEQWAKENRRNDVTVITAYQLELEMAEDASTADAVFFCDAHAAHFSRTLEWTDLTPRHTTGFTTHLFTPESLLEIVRRCYGTAPKGVLVSVPGTSFDMGDELTDETKRLADEAVALLKAALKPPGTTCASAC